jgi:5-methylcytosine-specific restriction endonuclease McrA
MDKCKNCGSVLIARPANKQGRNQLFCNPYCGKLFRGEIRFVDKPKNCRWCGVELVHVGAGNPKKFCSRQHAAKHRQSLKPKAPSVEKVCLFCSNVFVSNLKQSKFCSSNCRYGFAGQAKKDSRAASPLSFDYECDDCSRLVVSVKRVTRGQHGRYCDFCRLRRRRERYRVKTAKRQKVLNPVRMSADVLIERDGNVCHICLTEIDLSLARNSRFGATIDHVVPVSKGGADTLENMKLAHWICNIKKGNKV